MSLKTLALSLLFLPGLSLAAGSEDLQAASQNIPSDVADRAASAILCAEDAGQQVDKLIVVDMAQKATDKRLWAFDLSGDEPKLILNELVAHGSGSDKNADGKADKFSNTPNSNMTSLGLYKVAEAYHGKNGLSRRLDGLFKRFNSKARDRAVVMHPSNYVNPGKVGRSQGCPAVAKATMNQLEKAGLKNTVLWVDGPDQALVAEVQACARKHQARRSAEFVELVARYVGQAKDDDGLVALLDPTPATTLGLKDDASVQTQPLPKLDWEWDKTGKGQSIVMKSAPKQHSLPTPSTPVVPSIKPCSANRDVSVEPYCIAGGAVAKVKPDPLRSHQTALQRLDEQHLPPRTTLRDPQAAIDGTRRS